MQQVVTLVGVELKTGNGQNGPWTLYVFKDAGGNKFQTFDGALGGLAQQLMNRPVLVTYEIEQRQYMDRNNQQRVANNNVLSGVEPTDQQPQVVQPAQQPQGAPQPAQGFPAAAAATTGFDAKEARAYAFLAAVSLCQAGIVTGVTHPLQLVPLADTLLPYIEQGSGAQAFGTGVSSHAAQGDPGVAVDTAATAGPQY